ncbi:MAG: hypothetical protein AAFP76_03325 [Bacteroidota bacterium]
MNTIKKIGNLKLAFLFFLVFGSISIVDGGTAINRIIRVIPLAFAIVIILLGFRNKSHKYVIAFLLGHLLSGLFAIKYESPIYRELTIIFGLLGNLALGLSVIPKFNKIKTNWFLGIYFVICLVLAIYTLYGVTEISRVQLANNFHFILMNLGYLSLLFILTSAMLFVHQKPNKISMLLLGFVMVFALSELARGASYYSNTRVEVFFYGCRILYVLSLAILINCCGVLDDFEEREMMIPEVESLKD